MKFPKFLKPTSYIEIVFHIILYSILLGLSYLSYSSPTSVFDLGVFSGIDRQFDKLLPLWITSIWKSTGGAEGSKETKDDEGHHFSSLLAMKQLALNEQRIIVQMVKILDNLHPTANVGFRNSMAEKMTGGVKKIQRYVRDYDDSIRPMLLKTSLPVNPLMHFSWPAIFKSEADRRILQEIVASHPLISFRMLRRIHKDLPEIVGTRNILEPTYSEITPTVNEKDLIGAAEGVLRIQHTFNISALDLTNGKLVNFETRSGLKAKDAYFIAKIAVVDKFYSKAIDWLARGVRMVRSGKDTTVDAKILKDTLLQTIDKVHVTAATHNDLVGKGNSQHQTFAHIVEKDLEKWEVPRHHPVVKSELFTFGNLPMDNFNFEALCRGEVLRNSSLTKNLNCWYKRDNPYLIIKPLKAELHNEDPYIVQFYDILHDRVINHYKKLASPKLKRSLVLGRTDSKSNTVVSKVRISSNAWLQESGDEFLLKVPEGIKEATGLNAYSGPASELSQLSAYGPVGGFYMFHYDTLFDPTYKQYGVLTPEMIFMGDRLATVMFYLSDVKLGGGTAFPKIGVGSNAIKGSAMFWYNTKKNGKRDNLTFHGGCPVLYGEKWIINKWIRGGSQMFIKKCSTNADE